MLVYSKGVLRIAGDSLTIVNTAIVSTQKVAVMPKFIDVRTRKNNKRSFARTARRTFHVTAATRLGRNTADVFPALSSASFRGLCRTISIYRKLVRRPSSPVLNLRVRKPCLGPGVTKDRCRNFLGAPSRGRCVPLLRRAAYVGH